MQYFFLLYFLKNASELLIWILMQLRSQQLQLHLLQEKQNYVTEIDSFEPDDGKN